MGRPKTGKKKLALLGLFAGALLLFLALGGHEYVSFDALKEGREALLAYTEEHYALALVCAFAVYTAATAFSLPVATILSLAAGLLFGRWLGTVIIVVSGTVGATLLLAAARYVFTDLLQRRAAGRLHKLEQGFRRSAFLYVVFLRIVPVFPFWLVNLTAACTRISLPTYMGATAAGMIPISFVWASLGESLEHIDSPGDALGGTTLVALTALGLVGLAAIFAKNYWSDKSGKRGSIGAH